MVMNCGIGSFASAHPCIVQVESVIDFRRPTLMFIQSTGWSVGL